MPDRDTMFDRDTSRRILLIGWDGADWEHIDPFLEEGILPTLEQFINEGVMGNLATLQPILSPMLWNSVATGKLPDKHGIHGFVEPNPNGKGARPFCSTSRKCKALWNIFTQLGMRSNVVGWWASHPAEPIHGTIVSNSFNGTKFSPQKGWQTAPGTIHPPEKRATLAQMKVLQQELTHEHIFPFIPNADQLDQESDPHLASFAKIFTDCCSTHAVATAIMEQEPWDFMAIYYDTIDHFSHAFMQFHPPQMSNTPDDKFELFKDVIKGAYRFHDMMLQRLLELAGDDCTVIICSDHGFHSRHLRPLGIPREPAGPAIWHREFGMLAMRGPGLKVDERIYGASLVDVGPTILTLMNLPIGEDMDGRPLVEAFIDEPDVKTIPSWEDVEGECGMHDGEPEISDEDANDLVQQFVALGYVEDTGDDEQKAAENAEVESKYNVARTYMWTNRMPAARKLIEECVRRRPWEERFWLQLAQCYFKEGFHRQAEKIIRDVHAGRDIPPMGLLMLGRIRLETGDPQAAIDLFEQAEKAQPRLPRLHINLGAMYLKLRQFELAERAFKKALEIHEDSAMAMQGLSTVYRRAGRNQETADAALEAVSLIHRSPVAHFNLGVALARSGDFERAELAFQTTLKFRKNHRNAHRWLASLYRKHLNKPDLAQHHAAKASAVIAKEQRTQQQRLARTDQMMELPDVPSLEERQETLDRERPLPTAKKKPSGKTFLLVSGLPRSGTSLMMQMLAAGGIEPKTDGEREADVDNPQGYYEWEDIKKVAKKPELLDEEGLDNKVIKVISMLLKPMPRHHKYKVVFMKRPLEEVAASQAKMIDRLGTRGPENSDEQLLRGLKAHRDDILGKLADSEHMEFLEIDFPSLVKDPEPFVDQLVKFIGDDRLTNRDAMLAAVRPELYRNKST